MRKPDLPNIAREAANSLSDILEIEAIYNDGSDLILQGKPKIFQSDFQHLARTRLTNLGYQNQIECSDASVTLRIITGVKKGKQVPWVNIVLFLTTIISTMWVGALHFGTKVTLSQPERILRGWPYCFWLMSILTLHELGHYITAKLRKVRVSLPYFIPLPPNPFILSLFGTLGAVIKSRSPFKNRWELLEVGAMGPIAGFVVSVVALVVGLKLSEVIEIPRGTFGITFGDSILTTWLTQIVIGEIPGGFTVSIHPIGIAGWVGLLVTMLNLLPLGQLDGGHITYALFGKYQVIIGRIALLGLVLMTFIWYGWFIWILLGLLVMRPGHPPTLDDSKPLTPLQKSLGWISILIFILCFIPVPIS